MGQPYAPETLTREEVDAASGEVLLDFGTDWCSHCMAARASVDALVAAHPSLQHVRVEDGRGRPLGRSFRVKLWPTLVLMRDGVEVARVVRPRGTADIEPLAVALR